MKTIPPAFRLSCILAGIALLAPALEASVRFSHDHNRPDSTQTTFATSTGWQLPAGDWTIGIWDNNFQGNGGILISGPIKLAYVKLSSSNLAKEGRYVVGGTDSAGNLFGSGGSTMGIGGILPAGYPGRPTGKFMPRLHIIRRNAGKSEYLVAEGGHAPVLVSSETRPFTGTTGVVGWSLAGSNWDLYDSDMEGFFFATASISDADIALMAAGYKPSSVTSLAGNLKAYFPLETAVLSNPANPLVLPNQGSDPAIGLKRQGNVASFQDGPMLRGATAQNNTPAQVTEPTNVVALKSFEPFQIIRHQNNWANVQFNGFDYGNGTADIDIRFLNVEHGTSTAWMRLKSASPGGGAAVQATVSVPKGYWKTLEVKRVNSANGVGNSSRPNRTWARWAVGEVVLIMGDSIQWGMENVATLNMVVPNGFTAKYPSTYINRPNPQTFYEDHNPLSLGMWNMLKGTGMGGGTAGENHLANMLSDANKCCVGIIIAWQGATRLAYWNGRLMSEPYDKAKLLFTANNGLNKPNIVTWVGNLASANYGDDFYNDLTLFKNNKLNPDVGLGTYRLLLAPVPGMFDGTNGSPGSPGGLHKLRAECWRWVADNPTTAMNAGISIDHVNIADGVHPNAAAWNIMGPRWGNAASYLRDQVNYANPKAGEIVNFYRSAGKVIAQVQLYTGTALSLKNTGANITGFTLSSDNFATTIPIASATLLNATTVQITPTGTLPAGALKLRYLYGKPGITGSTPAQMGVDNVLYVNAGPTNTIAVQPIWGTSATNWALNEGVAP